MDPVIVSALLAGGVSLITSLAVYAFNARKLTYEYKVEMAIDHIMKNCIKENKRNRSVSFSDIKMRIRGFEDDQLRRHLISAGYVSADLVSGEELWWHVSHQKVSKQSRRRK